MRYRIFVAIALIAAVSGCLLLLQGCKKAEAKDAAAATEEEQAAEAKDSVDQFFAGLEEVLTANSLASIAIIEITDPKENDEHHIRNVRQATMEQLSKMEGIAVREVSTKRVGEVLGELKGTASTGLNSDDVMRIGIQLGVDALLFGSIESKQNDVFFWAYSGMSGDVIFSKTLEKWELAENKDNALGIDLSGLTTTPGKNEAGKTEKGKAETGKTAPTK